jgi:hypothetical protein
MEDFSQLCHVLRSEYNARSIPFSLRDYARVCLGSLADLISEDRPEQFRLAMAHFFAALCEGNALFNSLPVPSRNNLNSVTIGIPPRRLFELLNDFARVFNELSLIEISSKTVRSSLQENGFPYRPNELFSLLEQFERLDWSCIQTAALSTASYSTVDHDRLEFYQSELAKNKRLKYKQAAELWNKKEHDICDEGSFRQSCYRARKRNKT